MDKGRMVGRKGISVKTVIVSFSMYWDLLEGLLKHTAGEYLKFLIHYVWGGV